MVLIGRRSAWRPPLCMPLPNTAFIGPPLYCWQTGICGGLPHPHPHSALPCGGWYMRPRPPRGNPPPPRVEGWQGYGDAGFCCAMRSDGRVIRRTFCAGVHTMIPVPPECGNGGASTSTTGYRPRRLGGEVVARGTASRYCLLSEGEEASR